MALILDNYISRLTADVACVWLGVWAVRKKYEVDEELDRAAQIIRWSVVAVSFAVMSVPGPEFKLARILAAVVLLAFLCWPNFAYQLRQMFKRPRSLENEKQNE